MTTPETHLYRPYGHWIGHPSDCRCLEHCLPAARFNDKMFRYGKRKHYTREDFKPRAEALIAAVGGDISEFTRQTGFWGSVVRTYLEGGASVVPARVAAKFLAIKVEDLIFNPRTYPIEKFLWRVGVLGAMGYPKRWLSHKTGLREKMFYREYETINAEAWAALEPVWHEYKNKLADASDGLTKYAMTVARNRATKNGYHPFAAYDNEFDAQPASIEDVGALIRDDYEEIRDLVERRVRNGMLRNEIETELARLYPDVKDWQNAVERAQRRINRAA